MLMKLMKHEFRATGRIMVPALLILLATALGARLSTAGLLTSGNNFLTLLGGLLIAAYFIVIVGVVILSFVLMIVRFYKNLMGDEGYLMLTLPVSVHQHVWSKLLVAVSWMVVTGLLVVISVWLLVMGRFDASAFLDGKTVELFHAIVRESGISIVQSLAMLFVTVILNLMAGFMMIYASISIGCSFANSKLVWSIAVFFLIQFVMNLVGSLGLFSVEVIDNHVAWSTVWLSVGYALVQIGVFYGLTTWFMSRRLNLE